MSAMASALKQQAVRSPARRRSPRGAFHRMTDRQTLGRRGVINFITHEHRVTAQDVPDDPGAYSVRLVQEREAQGCDRCGVAPMMRNLRRTMASKRMAIKAGSARVNGAAA